ncbi:MAG: copper-binding protein [Acidiferrobacterales bacterium]
MLVSFILAGPPHAVFAAESYAASGTVKRVEIQAGQVNITHGPIAGLGWPGMTMNFPVKDKAVLRKLTPGERVDFWLSQEDGRYVITRIVPSKR